MKTFEQYMKENISSGSKYYGDFNKVTFDIGDVLEYKNMRIIKEPDTWLVEVEDVREAGKWVQITGTAASIIKTYVLEYGSFQS